MRINQLNNDKYMVTGYKTANNQLIKYLQKEGHVIGHNLKNSQINFANFLDPLTLIKIMTSKKLTVTQALTTAGDLDYGYAIPNIIKKIVAKYITFFCNKSAKVITISNYAKKMLQQSGVKKEIKVISCGIDLGDIKKNENRKEELRKSFRNEFGIKNNEIIVLSIGLRIIRKGIIEVHHLAKRMPQIKFIWIGHDLNHAYKSKLIKKIINSRTKNLIFTGYYENIHKAYAGADIFLFPTKAENEGIPLLEAAMHKLPIIASDIEVIREKIKNNYNGILCRNINEFEKAIIKLTDKKERARLGKNAYLITEKYDIKKTIKKFEKELEELIKH